ncbi:Ig-like domain-containing protein [Pontiellaceae bacterium B1224]|nr:Ig-like domain-containing protein [Pontiellaceae bacterium B1224]
MSNAYVAVTIDTGLSGDIHPLDKEPIGQRLALLGRKYALGENIEAHGPMFGNMAIAGNQVTLGFSHADGLTTDDALAPAGFELAGADEVWYAATSSSISGTNVTISSSSVSTPVAVRYAWMAYAKESINLINSAGLPAATFRTDDWAMPGLGAQAPMAVKDSYEILLDESLVVPIPGILENDIDLNRDALTASLVSDVNHGTLALAADGSFSYTPAPGFVGYDFFTYAASDGGLSENVIVAIAVQSTNGAPTFTTNAFYAATAMEDAAYTASIALSAIGPADMVFTNTSGPAWLSVAANGALTGTPGNTDVGLNAFTIEISDGLGRTDTATLHIEVEPILNRFEDTFDNDGLAGNTGIGGGLINKTWYGPSWQDNGNLTAPTSSEGWYRSLVYSDSSFSVSDGFTLDVTYDISKVAITGDERTTATFGLVSDEATVANMDFMFSREVNIYGIGMSLAEGLTDGVGVQGLHTDTGTLTPLSNGQTVTTGTDKTFSLSVKPDGSWSYRIDGAVPTTGTNLVFDLSKNYRFAAYVRQDPGFVIKSVSLAPIAAITDIGNIDFIIQPGGTEMGFSWFGESGATYGLEMTDNLVTGMWETVTNVAGANETISLTDEMDQTNAFYRVYIGD